MEYPKLTREKILEILHKVEEGTKEEDVDLVDFTLKPGAEKGDNYAGLVVACDVTAKVKGAPKEHHWMIKLPLDDVEKARQGRSIHMEEKEIMMYNEVIPEFKRIVKERNAEDYIRFNFCPSPHAEFHEEVEKGSVLVMENLRHMGYAEAEDKKKGLNLHYAKAALEELARFHAVGYVYIKTTSLSSSSKTLLTTDYFTCCPEKPVKDLFQAFKPAMVDGILDLLESVQEPGQDFVKAFRDFHEANDCLEFRNNLYMPNPDGFNTFCHGDMWFNNMMFYHDEEGLPTKACLFDLALTRWASPCTDLTNFLYLSVTPQLRRTHLDELLGHYHDTLVRCFHRLGEDPAIYPYRELRRDYDHYSFIGQFMSLWVLPGILCKKEDVMGGDDVKEEEEDPSLSKEEKMSAVIRKTKEARRRALANEPQIKAVVGGNFLEGVEKGFFKMP